MAKPVMNLAGFSLVKQLLLLLGFFFIGVFLASILSSLISPFFGEGSRNTLLIQSVAQNILAFMLPAWGCMRMLGNRPFELLGMERGFSIPAFLGLFVAVILGTVALNQVIYWNAEMRLPESWKALEDSWRQMEETNAAFTDTLVSDTSIWGLISGVLAVGVITGIGEEMFFRGGLQGTMIGFRFPPHLAIWLTAVIFSLMHFQMFGFVPRILLGAWFGYLYWWSGSLWLSATAHALNNTMVVVFTWLTKNGFCNADFEMLGVSESGFPWMALISAGIFTCFIWLCRGWFKPTVRTLS